LLARIYQDDLDEIARGVTVKWKDVQQKDKSLKLTNLYEESMRNRTLVHYFVEKFQNKIKGSP
jgi:hypothetical protein